LDSGCSFGELALIERKPRAATIVCAADCSFAILNKKDFLDILCIKIKIFLFFLNIFYKILFLTKGEIELAKQ
jgi:CRP-like cAMP-binding protein